jgi:hypothetical protein
MQPYVSTGKSTIAQDIRVDSGYGAAPRVTSSPSNAALTDSDTRDLHDRAHNAFESAAILEHTYF